MKLCKCGGRSLREQGFRWWKLGIACCMLSVIVGLPAAVYMATPDCPDAPVAGLDCEQQKLQLMDRFDNIVDDYIRHFDSIKVSNKWLWSVVCDLHDDAILADSIATLNAALDSIKEAR